jgi:hypothetical protein
VLLADVLLICWTAEFSDGVIRCLQRNSEREL